MKNVYDTDLWCQTGRFSREQADKMRSIVSEINPEFAIETGFGTGRSSASTLYGSDIKKMISIDISLEWTGRFGPEMASIISRKFPCFKLINGDSRNVMSEEFFKVEFPNGIDLSIIDGGHSYEECLFDIRAICTHASRGGTVVIDDYLSGPPRGQRIEDVDRAVRDFVMNNSEFMVERWNSQGKGFAILRRR